MDDTAGSRTESAESQPRDSDSASKAVDRDTIPIQENESSQQSTPDSDRPKRRIAIGTQRTDSVTSRDGGTLHVHHVQDSFDFR